MADSERQGNDISVCSFCLKEKGRYTCPRCGIRYCSTPCYKSEQHSQCSESFYKDCFMEGLHNYQASDDEKQKMMEMLSRLENMDDLEDVESDEDDTDLAERLAGIDLDGDPDKIWERLTEKERQEFSEMMEDGRLANIVETWQPWWTLKDSLIEEVGVKKKQKKSTSTNAKESSINVVTLGSDASRGLTSSVDPATQSNDSSVTISRECPQDSKKISRQRNEMPSQALMEKCPSVVKNIPDITKVLTKSKPSPEISYNMVNILYAYAYIVRLHSGDHMNIVRQCAQELIQLSDVIGSSRNHSNTEQALHSCLQCLREKARYLHDSDEFSLSVLEDIQKIIAGPSQRTPVFYVLAALSDIRDLFHRAVRLVGDDLKKGDAKPEDMAKLKSEKQSYFHIEKRMDFLLSWAQSSGHLLQATLPQIAFEHGSIFIEMTEQKATQEAVEKSGVRKKKKTLIEEIQS